MKKILLLILTVFSFTLTFAQVGIGTINPNGALDISSINDGILIPRVALVNKTTATIITPTTSELVYNTATSGDVIPGFYYWDGSLWIRIANESDNDWKLKGNAGTIPGTDFLGTTDIQDLRFKTNNTNRLNIDNINGQIQTYSNGTSAFPSYTWNNDTNTGIAHLANDNLNFITNGSNRVTIDDLGNVGINSTPQTSARLFSYTTTAAKYAIDGYSDIAGGFGTRGRSAGAGSYGLIGSNDNTGSGVYGTNSGSGRAILGVNNGPGNGIQGQASGINAIGVLGLTTGVSSGSNAPVAIYGAGNGTGNIGVFGSANTGASTSSAFGTYGTVSNSNATGNLKVAGNVGINLNLMNGTGYSGPQTTAANSALVGISGAVASKNTFDPASGGAGYHFGVMGETLVDSGVAGAQIQRRSGGTIGIGVSGVFGILGYKDSGNNNVGVYSTSGTLATGTGRMSNSGNSGIGLGVIGGVIGGYVKGDQYGLVSKGELFGAYILGNTFTNKPITQIETINNSKVITYNSTSTTVDVTTRGKGQLINGSGYISFDTTFSQIADLSDENLNITITAKGNTNGIFIERITKDGFYIKENMNGNNSVSVNWTAISTRKGYENGVAISKEILDTNWEKNIDGVMHNENDTASTATPIYFDGSTIKFESAPKGLQPEARKAASIKTKVNENDIIKKEDLEKLNIAIEKEK